MTDDAFILPPIFVVDGADVSTYDTLEDATAALEGVDVEDGVYSVYDADGRRILLKGVGVKRSRFTVEVGLVQVERIEARPTGAEDLRQALLQVARHRGKAVAGDTTLPELIELTRQAR